jgi:predicted glutamine amidotransferase
MITEEMISLILGGNEHRGVDATGMAFSYKDGSIKVIKIDEPAWKFISSKPYYEFIEENLTEKIWAVLLHTRAASVGNPRVNENNHPMYAGKSAIIHNGMIQNDNQLFNSMKLDRKAETDSDIIRAIVDKYGVTENCIANLTKINGSVATAIVSPSHPQNMIIARSGSPLTIASNDELFLFSSERNTLDRALKPWVKRFNVFFQTKRADAAFAPFADNTAWIMGAKGQEGHFEFKTLSGKYVEPFRRVYERYSERQKKWDEMKRRPVTAMKNTTSDMDEAYCPKCKTNWVIPKGADPKEYTCNKLTGGCDGPLQRMS